MSGQIPHQLQKLRKHQNLPEILCVKNGNNVYLNVDIPHNDSQSVRGSPTEANFFQVRGEGLLQAPASNYTMSVVRFSIPTSLIPLQLFPIDIDTNTNIDTSIYGVSIVWGAFSYQIPLQWITQDAIAPVPPNVGAELVNSRFHKYYSLYNVSHLVDLINVAINTGVNGRLATPDLPAIAGIVSDGFADVNPPFLEYDSETDLISLFSPATWEDSVVGRPEIYFNSALMSNFGSSLLNIKTGQGLANFQDNQLIIKDRLTNVVVLPAPYGAGIIQMKQDYDATSLMASLTSIVFTSNSLPVRSEWTAGQNSSGGQEQIGDSFQKILTDFEVQIDSIQELRPYIHYVPTAEYRRATLESDNDITLIDIQIFYKDNYGNLYPLMIPSHDVATIKILFEEK